MALAASFGPEQMLPTDHEAGRFSCLRLCTCGLLLGASIALLEFAYYCPLVSAPGQPRLSLLSSLLLSWCGEGLLFALSLALFERRGPWPIGGLRFALAVVVGSIVTVPAWQALMQWILREHLGILMLRDYVGQPMNYPGVTLYHAWLMLLFGGLAAALYVAHQRHAGMQAMLRAAELDRESSQRQLAEARLASLQSRIAPDYLLETLTRLENLYEADSEDADRLLDELIVFLRGTSAEGRHADESAHFVLLA